MNALVIAIVLVPIWLSLMGIFDRLGQIANILRDWHKYRL